MKVITTSDTQEALSTIRKCSSSLILCQGVSGSGKSTLYEALYKSNPRRTLCLAATGIAAQNLMDKGVPFASTIHSALSLKPVDLQVYHHQDYLMRKDLMRAVDTILIDEVSMVSCSLMDWLLHLLGDTYRDGHLIRLVLFGDILQLPPVTNQEMLWKQAYGTNVFFFNAKLYDKELTQTVMLNRIYRQKDPVFAAALTSLRATQVPQETLDLFNTRTLSPERFRDQNGDGFLTIVSTNKEKDNLDSSAIQQLQAQGRKSITYKALAEGRVGDSLKKSLQTEVTIYEGEKVMLTSNTDSYKNGAIGTVLGFTPGRNLPVVRLTSGAEVTVEYRELHFYTPMTEERELVGYDLTGSVKHIAAEPAYACTIHKTQGLTVDALYYQPSDRWIPPSGVYVALSRARTLDGIGLSRPLRKSDIHYSAEALAFYKNNCSD